jgi:acetate kinase
MRILAINPGGNSLKAEFVECRSGQRYAFEGRTLLSVTIEGIGTTPELSVMRGKEKTATEAIAATNYEQAAASFLGWWESKAGSDQLPQLSDVQAIAIRVVHGGREFDEPSLIDQQVIERIVQFEKLAPLHNKSSVEVLPPIRRRFPEISTYAVFDTAFHRHHIRRYGFHGISHRYLLERYAHLAGVHPKDSNIVSMHLESGCSVTAIEKGRSIDNTMGLTPLEGLMMGTRSGDIDPSIVALLMHEEHMTIDEVMTLLNKKSGLKGVSEDSLDTRVLMKEYGSNPKAKLAMDMFAYRVRKAVGSFVAVLGSIDAIVFGGGIAENGVFVRRYVCEGLRGFGLELDSEANERLIDAEGLLSKSKSPLKAWVIPTQEGRQMAHECFHAASEKTASGQR